MVAPIGSGEIERLPTDSGSLAKKLTNGEVPATNEHLPARLLMGY
jgi:hypothetical protein